MDQAQICTDLSISVPTDTQRRVLLLNPPVYDVRYEWARWHQPTGLLQVGRLLQIKGYDVRLIDCAQPARDGKLPRSKLGSVQIEGHNFIRWHFGLSWPQISARVQELREEGWIPDAVYVTCFTTFWWESVRDLISRVKREWFPQAQVLLGGVYATLEPEHAAEHTEADLIVVGSVKEARSLPPALDLYTVPPKFTGLYLYNSQAVLDVEREGVPGEARKPEDIVTEVADKVKLGVQHFAFFDEVIGSDAKAHFAGVLDLLAEQKLKIGLIALGNLTPGIVDHDLAQKMRAAGYRQVFLRCEARMHEAGVDYLSDLETYRTCVRALVESGGFRHRTDEITAMMLVGVPHENLEVVTERLIRLAHIVGSVNLVPYQFTPGTRYACLHEPLLAGRDGEIRPEKLNCKFYPLARLAGARYADYAELTRLATLLNSKYRSRTFDFLGDGFIARMVQRSIRDEGWKPLGPARDKLEKGVRAQEIIPLETIRSAEDTRPS